MDPGKAIGEHYVLIALMTGAVIALIGILRTLRQMLHAEISEGIRLSLTNGARDIIRDIVHSSVGEAVQQHVVTSCPIRERVASNEARIALLEKHAMLELKETDEG